MIYSLSTTSKMEFEPDGMNLFIYECASDKKKDDAMASLLEKHNCIMDFLKGLGVDSKCEVHNYRIREIYNKVKNEKKAEDGSVVTSWDNKFDCFRATQTVFIQLPIDVGVAVKVTDFCATFDEVSSDVRYVLLDSASCKEKVVFEAIDTARAKIDSMAAHFGITKVKCLAIKDDNCCDSAYGNVQVMRKSACRSAMSHDDVLEETSKILTPAKITLSASFDTLWQIGDGIEALKMFN